MASIIKAHTPTLGEVWCGISGRVPVTPLNVLRWKSNLLTFKKLLSCLFLLNFECDIGLIFHCGAKRNTFWITGKFTFSPFCQLQCTFKTIFSFTTVKVPVCLFVSTRDNVVMLWIKKKKQNEIKCETTLHYLGSISTWPYKFIHNLRRNTRKIVFSLILVNLQFLSNKHNYIHLSHFISFMHGNMWTNN